MAATLAGVPLAASATEKPGAGTAPQPAPTTGGSAGVTAADLQRQGQLDALLDDITGRQVTESEHTGNYAGAVVHPETGELSLYWKGVVPQAVKDAQASATAKGLRLTVTAAPYSAQELESARRRLEASTEGKDAATEPAAAWRSIGLQPDGTGLVVSYAAQDSALAVARSVPAAGVTAASPNEVGARAQALSGVPVRAVAGAGSIPTFTRWDDWPSPFYAGAIIDRPVSATKTAYCSTSFAGTRGGKEVMLTAAHCGNAGRGVNGQSWKTGSGHVIGATAGSSSTTDQYDTAFIALTSGTRGVNRFYDGAWNNASGYNKAVTSWGLNHDGDYVCASGAMTGVHCNLKVQFAGFDAVDDTGIRRYNLVQTAPVSGVAVGGGDSGGPVVASPDGKYVNMQERGIIHGASGDTGGTVTCGSTGVPTTCYNTVVFEGMSSVVNTLGFTPHLS